MEYKGGEKASESLRERRIARVSVRVRIRLYEIFHRVIFAMSETMLCSAYSQSTVWKTYCHMKGKDSMKTMNLDLHNVCPQSWRQS